MILNILLTICAGALLGSFLGRTRSCPDGGCPLTSTPKRGALWGGFLGLMVALTIGPGMSGEPLSAEAKSAFSAVTTTEEFQNKVLEHSGMTLVYFHADWCSACKKYTPALNATVSQKGKEVNFVMIDTDKAGALAQEYRVSFLPTTVIYKDGKEVNRFEGVTSEQTLINSL